MARSSAALRASSVAPAATPSPVTPPPAVRPEPRRKPGARPTPSPRQAPSQVPLIVILSVLAGVNLLGAPYYLLSMGDRVRSPLHAWFKPSGYIGQPAGILAFSIFGFLWLYPLRKKFRWLAFTGSVGRWLDVHVLTALALPLLLAIHAGWRFDGLIGLGYAAILVVCLSGVIGRYVYVRIPRSRSGLELSLEEIAGQRKAMLQTIADAIGQDQETVERMLQTDPTPCEGLGVARTIGRMFTDDIRRWRAAAELRRRWRTSASGARLDRATLRQVLALANREMKLTQQVRMLSATHRVFRYWHVAHRPVALTALVAVVVHVAVVVALGATWFW